jgi:predicted TIM-barrel fold metal-dependent hydrolase
MAHLINAHCHLLNYQFVSPACFKSRSAALEWMLRHGCTRPLVRTVAGAMPRKKLRRLHEVYDLLKMDIRQVAARLRQEMETAGIHLAVPLMVDMGRATFVDSPQIPYNFQLKQISDISIEHLGAIMPFAMVDPRRTRASDLTRRCLEEMGFLGLKMYPALGYHPDPDSYYNDPQTNDELNRIYDYCEHNAIPITTHCSPGGAYSNDVLRIKDVRSEFTCPASWAQVLKKYPEMYLNFAHFGQDVLQMKNPSSWSNQIRELVWKYPNVYTDLAYNKAALEHQTSAAYFESVKALIDKDRLLGSRIIFGTDWSMTRHTWREIDYVTPFRQLGAERLARIGEENSLDFLFPKRRYPERMSRFLRSHGKSVSDLPKWILANLRTL